MLMHDFSSAAAEQDGSSKNDFLDAILRERPDLRHELAYFPGQGRRAHTVFIGDEVFKTPKEWYGFNFDEEYATLQRLEGQGLPVPEVTCVGKEFVFYGMTRLPGVQMLSVYQPLTPDQRRVIAADIADFIVGMAAALPMRDGCYARHADLHMGNILLDPRTKMLSGIVDFGEIEYRAKSYLGLTSNHGFNKIIAMEYALREDRLPDTPAANKPAKGPRAAWP